MKFRVSLYCSLLFILLMFSLSSCFLQSRPRRAQRQLEKQHFAKTEKLLRKDLEKDSLNPAAYWLLSRLYLDTAYRQNIDTAHQFILKALRQAPLEDAKEVKRWRKLELDSLSLALQHQRVDSAAFTRASQQHSVAAYQYFLNNYPLAQEVSQAIAQRNALAFAAAEEVGSWQAYQQFFQTYPQAQQVAEARERYEELLFRERTQTGTLQAYRRFLSDYPQTPYRDRLLRNIYRLSTADHSPHSYYQYMRIYPESPYNQQALVQLYYLHGQAATLWQKFPGIPQPDSLQTFVNLDDKHIIAVLQGGKWGFITEDGEAVLPPQFDDVHPDYVCESLEKDFAEVLSANKPQLVAWNGQVLLDSDYEAIETIGPSLIRVQMDGKQGLMLKNSQWLLQPDYSAIRQLGPKLLLVEQGDQQGLMAPNGLWLLNPQADSLARLQEFILRIRGNRISVHSRASLITAASENRRQTPSFAYQSVQLLSDSLLVAIRPDSSWLVLNSNLLTLASGKRSLPILVKGALLVPGTNGYQVLNSEGVQVAPGIYEQAYERWETLALKQQGRWSLWKLSRLEALTKPYDSLHLLHPQLLWYRNNGRDSLQFLASRERIPLAANETTRLLRPQYVPDSLLHRRDQFDKLIVQAGRITRVYSMSGKLLQQGRYEDVQAPDPALLIIKNDKGLSSLTDTSGLILLRTVYDGIGNYRNGHLALLKNNRFGTFNPYQQVLINPQYDAAPRPYNQQLLLASKNKKWGIVDVNGKTILPHRFKSIRYYSDSIALVKEGEYWQLQPINDTPPLLTEILELRWVRQPEHPKGGIAIIEMIAGYGVASTTKGILAAPLFDDVKNLGTAETPLFYLERENRDTGLFEVMYLNETGKQIFTNSYTRAEWELLLCD